MEKKTELDSHSFYDYKTLCRDIDQEKLNLEKARTQSPSKDQNKNFSCESPEEFRIDLSKILDTEIKTHYFSRKSKKNLFPLQNKTGSKETLGRYRNKRIVPNTKLSGRRKVVMKVQGKPISPVKLDTSSSPVNMSHKYMKKDIDTSCSRFNTQQASNKTLTYDLPRRFNSNFRVVNCPVLNLKLNQKLRRPRTSRKGELRKAPLNANQTKSRIFRNLRICDN